MIVFTTSCNDSSSVSNTDVLNKTITPGQLKYIKIDDTQTFLPGWSKENILIYHITNEPDEMHPSNGNSDIGSEISAYTQVYLTGTDYQKLTLRPFVVKGLPLIIFAGGFKISCGISLR